MTRMHTVSSPVRGIRSHRSVQHGGRQCLYGMTWGFVISSGFLLCVRYMMFMGQSAWTQGRTGSPLDWEQTGSRLGFRGGLYVGLLTRTRDLGRSEAALRTWAKATSKVEIYSQTSPMTDTGLPIIPLSSDGAVMTESAAMFATLNHVCDHVLLDLYDWFLLSHDDVYVHVLNLKRFLVGLDPQSSYFLGQSQQHPLDAEEGRGRCSTRGGVVASRRLLKRVCPYGASCQEEDGLVKCVQDITGQGCMAGTMVNEMFYRLGTEERDALTTKDMQDLESFSALMGHHASLVYPLPHPGIIHKLHTMYLRERIRSKGWGLTLSSVSKEELKSQLYIRKGDKSYTVCTEFKDYVRLIHKGNFYGGHACQATTSASDKREDLQQIYQAGIYHSSALDADFQSSGSVKYQPFEIYSCSAETNMTEYIVHITDTLDDSGYPMNLTKTRIEHQLQFPVVIDISTFGIKSHLWVIVPARVDDIYLDDFLTWWKEQNLSMKYKLLIVSFKTDIKKENGDNQETNNHVTLSEETLEKSHISILKVDGAFSLKSAYYEGIKHIQDGLDTDSIVILTQTTVQLGEAYFKRCLTVASTGKHYLSLASHNQTVNYTTTRNPNQHKEKGYLQLEWLLRWDHQAGPICFPLKGDHYRVNPNIYEDISKTGWWTVDHTVRIFQSRGR